MALGLSLALWGQAQAAQYLTWECTLEDTVQPCPRGPQAPTWTLTMMRTTRGTTTQETLTLTALPPEQCQVLPAEAWTDGYQPALAWCALLPCPGPGAFTMVLQANDFLWANPPVSLGFDHACEDIPYDQALAQALPLDLKPTPAAPPTTTTPPAAEPLPALIPPPPDPGEGPEEGLLLAPGVQPPPVDGLVLPPTSAAPPAMQAQLAQIEQAYQAKQAAIRARYQQRLAPRGTRLARLTALWQAYREESAALQDAYREAWAQWQAVMTQTRERQQAAGRLPSPPVAPTSAPH